MDVSSNGTSKPDPRKTLSSLPTQSAMTPKKFQIFVSSTYTDLAEVRRGVIDSIQRMNHFPVGMEQFSADDDEQWQIIQETIQQTDYYICLIGQRYGSIGKGGASYTEMEWDYAKSLNIPIMSFVRDRKMATTPDERDTDPSLTQRLDAFIEKVTAAKMVDFWTDPKDLNLKVVTALPKAFARKPRPGWIRTESERVAEEMALMMEENRGLRNQLEKVTAQVTGSRPTFKILFNGKPELSIQTLPKAELKRSPRPPLVEPISWESIPSELKRFLTSEEIEAYNFKLPSSTQINEIFGKIHSIEIAKQTASPLIISIKNDGNAKAREVIIEISFPNTVVVMEKEEFEKLEAPEFKSPPSPLIEARRKLKESTLPRIGLDIHSSLLERMWEPNFSLMESIHHPMISSHHFLRTEDSCDVEKNKVSIWIKDLMHTRQREFANLVIIPTNPSVGTIEVSMICEEIPAPQKETIRIEVTEKSQISPPAKPTKPS